jgi:hypothetical protein
MICERRIEDCLAFCDPIAVLAEGRGVKSPRRR